MPSLRRAPRKLPVAGKAQAAAAEPETPVRATTGAEVSAERPACAGERPPAVEHAAVCGGPGSPRTETGNTGPPPDASTGERGDASAVPPTPASSNGAAGRLAADPGG